MIVVADTSPINYLVQIKLDHLLHRLFGTVIIPLAVHDELTSAQAPTTVSAWARDHPNWIHVVSPQKRLLLSDTLHEGELEGIALAQELHADLLLIDELAGRLVAVELGIAISGTLGVLRDAHNQRWIDGRLQYQALRRTSFRCSARLELAFLASLTNF